MKRDAMEWHALMEQVLVMQPGYEYLLEVWGLGEWFLGFRV